MVGSSLFLEITSSRLDLPLEARLKLRVGVVISRMEEDSPPAIRCGDEHCADPMRLHTLYERAEADGTAVQALA
jgi:hypothetical protein